MRQTTEEQQQATAGLVSELEFLESAADPKVWELLQCNPHVDSCNVAQTFMREGGVCQQGPFLLGANFSLVDAAVLPWFLRMYILKQYRGFELPASCTRLAAWCGNISTRQSVLQTMVPPQGSSDYAKALLQHYERYADGTANSTSAKDFN